MSNNNQIDLSHVKGGISVPSFTCHPQKILDFCDVLFKRGEQSGRQQLLTLIKQIEWVCDEGHYHCPWCNGHSPICCSLSGTVGHKPHCSLISIPELELTIASLPKTCCKNVGTECVGFCNKPAQHWYKHNEDICSYCDEHKCECGIKL